MRVATFNLLHGMCLADGLADEAALTEAVASLDADVLGIQEVDRNQPRSGSVDQAAAVARALDAPHWRFVPALLGTPDAERSWTVATEDDGTQVDGPTYGIGLASRWPVRSWQVRRFPAAPVGAPLRVPGNRRLIHVYDEPRVALAALVDAPGGPVTVVTAHLSFIPGWNLGQLRRVTRWALGFPAPRLLLGDLNVPGRVPARTTGWAQLARVPTYPSYRPRVQFDHVLGHSMDGMRVGSVSSRTLGVSDHCALTVDLEVTGHPV
ncbi:MAG: endonuclease/exonuclease/phosphatase family protein [Actinomycetes bacterium]